jgi:hypothetical protein
LGIDAFWGHIGSATRITSLCNGINQLARDAKIAQFDVSTPIEQDVGRLDVTVDDLEFILEIVEGTDHSRCDLTDNGLGNDVHLNAVDELVELVQADVHDLHADPAVALLEDGTVEEDDEGALVGLHHHLEVHEQTLLLTLIDSRTDPLDSHNALVLLEHHLVDGAEGTPTNLTLVSQVFSLKVVLLPIDLKLASRLRVLVERKFNVYSR